MIQKNRKGYFGVRRQFRSGSTSSTPDELEEAYEGKKILRSAMNSLLF